MDKHRRPYRCTEVNCNTRNFGSKGDLKRHRQTLHNSRAFICTIPACKRRGKAFGRKDNLSEHLKRIHGVEHPFSLVTVVRQTETDMEDDTPEEQQQENTMTEGEGDEFDEDEMEANTSPLNKALLKTKLAYPA